MAHIQSASPSESAVGTEATTAFQLEPHNLTESSSEKELASKLAFEARFTDGSTRDFDLAGLRAAILAGELRRTDEVRADRSEDTWVTIDVLKNALGFPFQVLYTPVWAHTMRGMTYGALAGIGLKAVGTLFLLWTAQPIFALSFLIIIGSLFVARWVSFAPIAAAFYTAFMCPGMNLWITLFAVALVGAIFGGPLGALIGTIVGHFRKSSLALASDAEQEDHSTYWWGIFAPIAALAILVPLYIFWFMPMVLQLLSK